MTVGLTVTEIRGMDSAELLRRLGQYDDLTLYRLPQDMVQAMPREVLIWRRDKLYASRHPLRGSQVEEVCNISAGHFARLRRNYIAIGFARYDALPAPDDALSDPDIKRPGDTGGRRGGSPRWTLGAVLTWLNDWERFEDPDALILRPGGREPPGRPPDEAKVALPAPRPGRGEVLAAAGD